MGILSLTGKNCIITGATGTIGFAIAQNFASAGAAVTLVGRNEESLAARLRDVEARFPNTEHGGHRAVREDTPLTSARWRHIISSGPPPHVLVNCAGASQNLRILRLSEADADEILDVNLRSAIFGCKEMGRSLMLRKTAGCIINVSSLLAYKGAVGVSVYAASKAGLLGLTASLAVELGGSGIRINAIVPGYIETNMTKGLHKDIAQNVPLKRFGTAEEVADAVAFLVRNEYANNCILNLDGGLSAV